MLHARFRSRIPVPVDELFAWHAQPGAFERLVPPWQRVIIVGRTGSIQDGDTLQMQIALGPVGVDWVALHSHFEDGVQFRDTQVKGPFSTWVHTHRTHADGHDGSILDDNVSFELPLSWLTERAGGGIARRQIRRMFRFRHLRTRLDLMRHHAYRELPRTSVAVLGGGAFASQLTAFLTGGNHRVDQAQLSVDLSALDSSVPGEREVRIQRSGTLQRIPVPEMVIGPSFSEPALRRLRQFPPSTVDSEAWIAEDDLIGRIYHAILVPEPESTVDSVPGGPVRFFTHPNHARKFASGRL